MKPAFNWNLIPEYFQDEISDRIIRNHVKRGRITGVRVAVIINSHTRNQNVWIFDWKSVLVCSTMSVIGFSKIILKYLKIKKIMYIYQFIDKHTYWLWIFFPVLYTLNALWEFDELYIILQRGMNLNPRRWFVSSYQVQPLHSVSIRFMPWTYLN